MKCRSLTAKDMKRRLKKLLIASTHRSYGNLSRFFMRMFGGIMFMQFGIRQIANYDFFKVIFPDVFGIGSEPTVVMMIVIELVCSVFLILGLFTRAAAIPPIISMIIAEGVVLSQGTVSVFSEAMASEHALLLMMSMQPGYLPLLFIGYFFFILLAGPGKISVDYLLSLYYVNKESLDELKNL